MKSPLETKVQLAILAEAPDGFDGLCDTTLIEWLFCKQTGNSVFDFYKYKDEAIISSVNLENARFDLQDLMGIIVVGSAEKFEAIKDNWQDKLPFLGLPFKQVPKSNDQAILCAGMECIADSLTLQRRNSGRAALELATYRREFDRLQHSFSRLEEYVGRQSFQRATEIFEYPPDAVTENNGRTRFHGVTSPFARSLIQYLPVDSLGLSSLSIHISAKPEVASEPLGIRLKAIETGDTFGGWSISADKVRTGWVELALNCAIDESALTLELIVEWPPDTSGWALALGPRHPYKEFCARTEAGEHLGAPIALRIFSSLPGVRIPATTTAIRPIDAPHVLAEFIPYDVYQTVAQVLPPLQDNKPTLVFYDREIGCITVHPRVGGLTVARMNVVVPKHAWGVSAQIHLAHEQASPTQFGLMACAARDERRELARLDQLDAPSPIFSGWKSLAPLETKSISVLLAASQEEQLPVYLVTRQAPDLSPDFAWARFSKFEFNVLPKSLISEKESDQVAPVVAGIVYSSKPQAIEPGVK